MVRSARDHQRGLYAAAIVVGQAVDSLIFFPVALMNATGEIGLIAAHGFAIKLCIGLLLMPVVWWLSRRDRISEIAPRRLAQSREAGQ
jgi:uncharacterized PurR-regulated membrane protein YhhQ (DUF165 family)